MASLSDLILGQVKSATGNIKLPENLSSQVLGGLSDSILGGLTQTATKTGGLDIVKDLLTGKADAAKSPVTAAATNIFANNVLSKLNLGALGTSLTAAIPTVLSKLSGIIQDRDGDGDVDLNDILLTLQGGSGKGILGSLTGMLGGLFGGKK